jgi:hypothetical protein
VIVGWIEKLPTMRANITDTSMPCKYPLTAVKNRAGKSRRSIPCKATRPKKKK